MGNLIIGKEIASIEADNTRLANTSGTNTGDQVLPINSDFSLSGLSDTTITTPTDTQVLTYDNATGKWINAAAPSGGGIGSFISTSIAISSDNTALANDDGTLNENIGIGLNALNSQITGIRSVAIGSDALKTATGNSNVGIGYGAGKSIGTGATNTFVGYYSAINATSGATGNTILGAFSVGAGALTGSYNNVIGYQSGNALTTGQYNVLNGYQAGYGLTTGLDNIAIGFEAGRGQTTQNESIAIGKSALKLTNAYGNIAIGTGTIRDGLAGASNIALGVAALSDLANAAEKNIAIGYLTGANKTSGSGCIFIGSNVGLADNSSNKLLIGNNSTESLIQGDFTARTLQVNGSIQAEDFIGIKRHISVIAVEKSTAIVNGTDILGAIEIPFDCTIVEIRAKTATGTCTVDFKNGGLAVGSVAATTTGVSNTTLTNTAVGVWDDLTIDVSLASGNGLAITVVVQEV